MASELLSYNEVRERFFKLVNDRPDDIDLISHNCAAVLMKGTAWPEKFTPEQIGVAIESCLMELNMRWELARNRRPERD